MPTIDKIDPDTLAEPELTPRQRLLAEKAVREEELRAAWASFVDDVKGFPGQAPGSWATYRLLVATVQAWLPPYQPLPPGPGQPGGCQTLRLRHQVVFGMAKALKEGRIEGNAHDEFVRSLTTSERTGFAEAIAEYRQAVADHQQTIEDYSIWHRLMTTDEREKFGYDGGRLADRLPQYAERAQEFRDRTGQPAFSDAQPSDQYGLPLPNPDPTFSTSSSQGLPTPALVLPFTPGTLDDAITAALAS